MCRGVDSVNPSSVSAAGFRRARPLLWGEWRRLLPREALPASSISVPRSPTLRVSSDACVFLLEAAAAFFGQLLLGASVGPSVGTGKDRPTTDLTWPRGDSDPGGRPLVVGAAALPVAGSEEEEILWLGPSSRPPQ